MYSENIVRKYVVLGRKARLRMVTDGIMVMCNRNRGFLI